MSLSSSRATRRRPACCLAVALAGLGAIQPAMANLELPEWEAEEEAGGDFVLGGGLWPADSTPGEIETAENVVVSSTTDDQPIDTTPGAPPPIVNSPGRAEDLAALTRPSILGIEGVALKPVEGLRVPTPMLMPLRIEEVISNELPPVEGNLKDEFFALAPIDHLVDPQQLLTEQKAHDIERFLQYHAEEAEFDICLLLFGGTQEIPNDISLEQKHREWFGNQPIVTVAYFLAHPERTEIVYGENVTEKLPQKVFEQIFKNCVQEAQVAETPFDQVERLAIELSIRLYWLAKTLKREEAGEETLVGPVNLEGRSGELPPVVLGATVPGSDFLGGFPWILAVTGGVILISAFGGVWWWWRRDSLGAKPMLFPELEVPSRLGGSFSGGGYVGISFNVSSQPDP